MITFEWLERSAEEASAASAARARVRVPVDSAYFAGHFPSQPVLPAVAQLALVDELMQELPGARQRGWSGVKQARFRGSVGPDDEVTLEVELRGDDVRFRIDGTRGPVSQGVVTLGTQPLAARGSSEHTPARPPSAASVERFLPHRAPALLLRAVDHAEATGARGRGWIPAESPFARGGSAPAYLALELGAQAAAAAEGYARAGDGTPPAGLGFIVGLRGARFHGSTLEVACEWMVAIEAVEAAPPLRTYEVVVSGASGVCVEGRVSTWSAD